MISVLYFARIREALGKDKESIEYESSLSNVQALKQRLMERGEVWRSALGGDKGVLVAVNQEMAGMEHSLDDGDEVAFFPPVSGG
ncbi:MAG: molybdopterin converting factor subunit 1 [Pseudomonadales bacterium]|nr:molybdopterin converting factor subunit 1 [Pseudomonadales bacterium]